MYTTLVLGNGFDIDLNLPTSYNDYVASDIFKEFASSTSLGAYLKEKHDIQKWIDVEIELYKYSRSGPSSDFNKEYRKLRNNLSDYLRSIDYSEINEDCNAFRLLYSLGDRIEKIIYFNYTHSIKICLDRIDINVNPVYVHGSITNDNIIIGVDDVMARGTNFNFIKKSYYPNFGQNQAEDSIKDAAQLIFFGHSIGKTDHTYFRGLFNKLVAGNGPKTIFTHYGVNGFDDIMNEQYVLTNNKIDQMKHQVDANIQYTDSSKAIDWESIT